MGLIKTDTQLFCHRTKAAYIFLNLTNRTGIYTCRKCAMAHLLFAVSKKKTMYFLTPIMNRVGVRGPAIQLGAHTHEPRKRGGRYSDMAGVHRGVKDGFQ